MAVTRGCAGKVFVSATGGTPAQVAEVTSWSFESTAENLDSSSMGSCTKSFVGGPVQTQISLECNWDLTDAEQVLLAAVGTNVKVELYPGGNASGSKYYKAASALIGSFGPGADVNGFVKSSIGLFVNGAMTTTTVP